MTPRAGGWLRFAARALVSVATLALALALLDWRQLGALIERLDAGALAGSALIDVALLITLAFRWWLMVRPAAPLPFSRHLAIYLGANLMNLLTPANLGGDVYRVVALRKHGEAGELAVALVRERLIGLIGYFVTFLICATVLWKTVAGAGDGLARPLAVAMAAAAAGLLAVLFGRWLTRRLTRSPWLEARHRLRTLTRHAHQTLRFGPPARATTLFALTLLGLVLWIAAVWMIARRLTPDVPIVALGAVVVIAEVVRLVPITVQGLGVREAAYAFSFEIIGADGEAGFLIGAAAYLVLAGVHIVAGAIAWAGTPIRGTVAEAVEENQ